ncbi:DUF4114 domain-containing protein [Aliamphritea spongicola]|nr:DUF4114 domain-containing protein [Aliamphritea spongicola]
MKGWDTGHDNLAMYTIDFLNPENSSDAYISTGIDEDARHVAMMSSLSATNDYILGFEDLKRPWGDNDFNDAVFRIRPTRSPRCSRTSRQLKPSSACRRPLCRNWATAQPVYC